MKKELEYSCTNCGAGLKKSACDTCDYVNKEHNCGGCGSVRDFAFDYCIVCREPYPDVENPSFSYDEELYEEYNNPSPFEEPVEEPIPFYLQKEMKREFDTDGCLNHNTMYMREIQVREQRESIPVFGHTSRNPKKYVDGQTTTTITFSTMVEPVAITKDNRLLWRQADLVCEAEGRMAEERQTFVKADQIVMFEYAFLAQKVTYYEPKPIKTLSEGFAQLGKALKDGGDYTFSQTNEPYKDLNGNIRKPSDRNSWAEQKKRYY
jgi:hypothetical protein